MTNISNATCFNAILKKGLQKTVGTSQNPHVHALLEHIGEMPDCTPETMVVKQKGKKGERPLSAYNIHLKSCMGKSNGGRGLSMKECVAEWKQKKST